MAAGLAGLSGQSAVPRVVRDFKGGTGDATAPRHDGEDPFARGRMSRGGNAQPLVPVSQPYSYFFRVGLNKLKSLLSLFCMFLPKLLTELLIFSFY